MAQTKEGRAKARATMVAKLGGEQEYLEHMRSVSASGGKAGGYKGFATRMDLLPTNPAHPSNAGRKGGTAPRRKKTGY